MYGKVRLGMAYFGQGLLPMLDGIGAGARMRGRYVVGRGLLLGRGLLAVFFFFFVFCISGVLK